MNTSQAVTATKTPREIRTALRQLAERNNRPHFTNYLVMSVIEAFRTGEPHHLKSAVEQEKIKSFYTAEPSIHSQLIKFCSQQGIRPLLAAKSGYTVSQIENYVRGKYALSEVIFRKLQIHFDDVQAEYYQLNPAKAVNTDQAGSKKCTCCNLEFPNTQEFYVPRSNLRKDGSLGLSAFCRPCYYKRNRQSSKCSKNVSEVLS